MSRKILLILLCAQLFGSWKLVNIRSITSEEEGKFIFPTWTPDGEKIIFRLAGGRPEIFMKNADGSGNLIPVITESIGRIDWKHFPLIISSNKKEVKITNINKRESKTVIKSENEEVEFYRPTWLDNGDLFYIKRKRIGLLETCEFYLVFSDSLGNIKKEIKSPFLGKAVPSFDGRWIAYEEPKVEKNIIYYSDVKIWLTDSEGKNKKLISEGAIISSWSKDSKKILMEGLGAHLYVFNIENGKKYFIGVGNAGEWLPDNEWIIYQHDKDDGHYILESDIWVSKWDGSEKFQLTRTPDLIEIHPSPSPKDNKIVFEELTTGKIYVGDIIYEEGK